MAYNNGPTIITNGLVLALDAGDNVSYPGSGTTWVDVSGNGNNGTLINGVGFNSGNYGSLVFDGVNDYVGTNNFSLDFGTQSFTIGAWIRTPNNTQSGKIINKGQSGAFPSFGNAGYSLRFFGGVFFSVGDGINVTSLATLSIDDIPNNVWKFFIGICNRETSTQLIYIDGNFNNSSTITYGSVSNPEAELTIGNLRRHPYGGDGEFLNGNVSQVQIYNRALTAQEVLQNYNATKGRYGL